MHLAAYCCCCRTKGQRLRFAPFRNPRRSMSEYVLPSPFYLLCIEDCVCSFVPTIRRVKSVLLPPFFCSSTMSECVFTAVSLFGHMLSSVGHESYPCCFSWSVPCFSFAFSSSQSAAEGPNDAGKDIYSCFLKRVFKRLSFGLPS